MTSNPVFSLRLFPYFASVCGGRTQPRLGCKARRRARAERRSSTRPRCRHSLTSSRTRVSLACGRASRPILHAQERIRYERGDESGNGKGRGGYSVIAPRNSCSYTMAGRSVIGLSPIRQYTACAKREAPWCDRPVASKGGLPHPAKNRITFDDTYSSLASRTAAVILARMHHPF